MRAAETFRAREVYRYYQPKDLTEAGSDPSSTLQVPGKHLRKTNFTTQQSFSDTALTAFAQLIALRLECQRAIVSLIDHENEYFLAESTSTFSLIADNGPAHNAWLSISGARVPRSASLCEQTLKLKPNQDTTAEMTPFFLVPDLQLDDKMSLMECVKRWDLRFYCGVALTNMKGVNIGCVYVVDDQPRTDFTLEQAQFLTQMAATVMDHLENIRAKEDIVRVTKMSQALHAFIEGDGTMDGDWQRLKRYNLPSGAGEGFHWETNKDDGTGSNADGRKDQSSASSRTNSYSNVGIGESPLQSSGMNYDARHNFNNSPSEVTKVPPAFDMINGAGSPMEEGRDAEFTSMGFSGLLQTTFSRASNLVREGMEVDGAVYFDAPYRFYQGRSTLETDLRTAEKVDKEYSSDEEVVEVRPGPTPHAPLLQQQRAAHAKLGKVLAATADVPGLKSEVLGYSTHNSSSWNNQTMDSQTGFTPIDQSLLTALVRRYPQGELFVFNESGPINPHSASLTVTESVSTLSPLPKDVKKARHRTRKRAEIIRLLDSFPGARQIFFCPLYDSTSGCFIGSFAWSTSATRIFSLENHHSYLVAFGVSVMSEVSRLNTLSADRAKGEFISNVSHELRSPLHGILASVEFLADSTLDGFQRNLVDTIDICGRTLLDTIEHVLDFSKMKKFGQESMQPMGLVADIDVSAVVEEVLEGVFAGFEFNGLSSQGLADTTQSHTRDAAHANLMSPTEELQTGISSTNDQMVVILDIDFRENWKFPSVPGIWRRLTMNLFGNALKYTTSGYIKIKLEARNIPTLTSNVGVEQTMVVLTFTDSGRGISPEFMSKKLFMPFSQEDATAPGTGLGMSMVKQIVELSGGKIDIQSEVGKGTEVKLSLPLTNHVVGQQKTFKLATNPESEDPVETLRRRASGRTVALRGFESIFGDSELRKASLSSLRASIEKYVTEWFNLTLSTDDKAADIVISDETAFLSSAGSSFRSQVILCSNGARRNIYMSRLEPGQAVEFVGKPCGPHRIAKALLNCLDTEEVIHESVIGTRSSIGFSPRTFDPNKYGSYSKPKFSRSLLSSSSAPSILDINKEKLKHSSHDSSIGSVEEETPRLGKADPGLPPTPEVPLVPAQRKPKMLLVEDNPVNMMLLATYMKKNGWEYEKAENGLLALQAFQIRPEGFDVIFMDVSMPIMTGYESTKAIRACEAERLRAHEAQEQQQHLDAASPLYSPDLSPNALLSTSFPFDAPGKHFPNAQSQAIKFLLSLNPDQPKPNPPVLIIALTGFSSQKDQEMAFESGVDVFMTKPVRFREVGRILEGWMKSREVAA